MEPGQATRTPSPWHKTKQGQAAKRNRGKERAVPSTYRFFNALTVNTGRRPFPPVDMAATNFTETGQRRNRRRCWQPDASPESRAMRCHLDTVVPAGKGHGLAAHSRCARENKRAREARLPAQHPAAANCGDRGSCCWDIQWPRKGGTSFIGRRPRAVPRWQEDRGVLSRKGMCLRNVPVPDQLWVRVRTGGG